MISTIARQIAIAGVFAVLLVPFIITESTFFPYIVGKAVFFRIVVALALGAWAVLAVFDKRYRPTWSPIMIAATVFLGVVGIADALGFNPMRSLWSNFERMEGWVTIFFIVVYLFVAGAVMHGQKLWTWFFNSSIVISVLLSLHAFGEINPLFPGQLVRVDATLGNPTYLAVYLLINIFIALFCAYRSRGSKMLVSAYAVAVALQIVALYYTGTRGAFLGLVAGVAVAALIIFVRGKQHPTMRRVAGVVIGCAIFAGGLFMAIRDTALIQNNPTLARVANISLTDTTVQSRLTLWTSIGWNAFLERPVLGWGQDNFIVAFGKYYEPIMYKQEPWFDRAHNVFMDWLVAGGLLGFLAYIGLFGAAVWMLWRSSLELPEKAIIAGALVAYAVNNVFVFDNLVSYIYFVILLAYIHARSLPFEYTTTMPDNDTPTHIGVAVVVSVAVVALVWFGAMRPLARAQTLIDTIQVDYQLQDIERVLVLYEKALAYGPITGLEETREQLSQSAIRAMGRDDGTPEARAALVTRAVEELITAVNEEPGNTRRLYFLAHILKEAGQLQESRKVFEDALAINPTRQNFLYEVAQTYIGEGNFEAGAETFKQAYDAEPENDTAYIYYAATLMHGGRFAEGESLLVERFGTTTIDNDLLFRAYDRAKRYDKIVEILLLRLKNKAPLDDPMLRVTLALAYVELGDKESAIAQLEQAMALEPKFAEQGAQMIQAIKDGRKIQIK